MDMIEETSRRSELGDCLEALETETEMRRHKGLVARSGSRMYLGSVLAVVQHLL
jgi:hypothetical protein